MASRPSLSEDNSYPQDTSSPTSSRKRGRAVRQLSEQQLAKKRQNDRDAQRAIRERTKHTIESLQRRVQELESGQGYGDYGMIIQERDALRAENQSLRDRLTSVLKVLNPTGKLSNWRRRKAGKKYLFIQDPATYCISYPGDGVVLFAYILLYFVGYCHMMTGISRLFAFVPFFESCLCCF